MPGRKPYLAIDLGPLPVDLINDALGTDLEPGHARPGEAAHRHMAVDHPADYPVCIAEIEAVIASPPFIGQAPRHNRNFEMIRRAGRADGSAVLAAVGQEPDNRGDYGIRTCYLPEAEKLEERRQKGWIRMVVPR